MRGQLTRDAVRRAREPRARVPVPALPALLPVDSAPRQRPAARLQRQQVRQQCARVWTGWLTLRRVVITKTHTFDATEIFRALPQHKKEAFVRLGFYLLSFFYYLYRCALRPAPRLLRADPPQDDPGADIRCVLHTIPPPRADGPAQRASRNLRCNDRLPMRTTPGYTI